MDLPVPTDVVLFILAKVGLGTRARCELVCKAFRQVVYSDLKSLTIATATEIRRTLVAKGSLFSNLRTLALRTCADWVNPALLALPKLTKLILIRYPEGGKVFNQVASSGAPLKSILITSPENKIYHHITDESVARLKGTLRKVFLFEDHLNFTLPNPQQFTDLLLKHIGDNLKALGVTADLYCTWRFTPPTSLKELYISSSPASRAVRDNPEWMARMKSQGLHVFTRDTNHNGYSNFDSQLSIIARSRTRDRISELIAGGFDPLVPICTVLPLPTRKVTHLAYFYKNTPLYATEILKGFPGYWGSRKQKPGTSIFVMCFNVCDLDDATDWKYLVEYLFGARWNEALKHHTPAELLHGLNGPNFLFDFPPNELAFQFIESRPDVFGQSPLSAISPDGCSLFHFCQREDAVANLWAHRDTISWSATDRYGMNALECLAKKGALTVESLLSRLSPAQQTEFLTPTIWSGIFVDFWTPTQWKDWVVRFLSVVPKPRQQEYFTHWVQTSLRLGSSVVLESLLQYTGVEVAEVEKMTLTALISAYDVIHWYGYYRRHRLMARCGRKFLRPLFATVTACMALSFKLSAYKRLLEPKMKAFLGEDEYLKWCST